MFTVFVILHVIVCLFLVLIVLLQSGKGGGIGVLGGGGASVLGARTGGTFMSRMTTVTAGLFMVTSMVLARLSIEGSAVQDAVQSGVLEAAPVDDAAAPAEGEAAPAGEAAPTEGE